MNTTTTKTSVTKRGEVEHASGKESMVHAKIKKHPLILFMREPLESYKRVRELIAGGGESERRGSFVGLRSKEARVANQELTQGQHR